jgi:nucleoside-diphosphate-sugar epimerase
MTAAPMQIVLLGGSGFVGRAILRAAATLPRGAIRVRALLRSRNTLPEQHFLEQQLGDLEHVSAEIEPDARYVLVHFAVKQIDHDRTGFAATNVRANRRLERLLSERLCGVIYASSMSVYGAKVQDGIGEDAEPRPASPLARSRYAAEELWLNAASRRGIGAYMLRPRFVLGRGDRYVLPGLASAYARGLMPGSGHQRFSVIDADDYAQVVLELARRCSMTPTLAPRALNVGYARPLRMLEIEAALSAVRPAPKRHWRVPASEPWLSCLRLAGGRRGDALATRLELLGLSHWGRVSALEAEIGTEITTRDPLTCVTSAAVHLSYRHHDTL